MHTEEIEGKNRIILDSSMVEPTAVNRVVVGSSPTRGVKQLKTVVQKSSKHGCLRDFSFLLIKKFIELRSIICGIHKNC